MYEDAMDEIERLKAKLASVEAELNMVRVQVSLEKVESGMAKAQLISTTGQLNREKAKSYRLEGELKTATEAVYELADELSTRGGGSTIEELVMEGIDTGDVRIEVDIQVDKPLALPSVVIDTDVEVDKPKPVVDKPVRFMKARQMVARVWNKIVSVFN